MFKGDVMEILNIKSKYELGRGLNKNNFEIRKVVKGRKTYINNLIDNGVNIKIVCDLVGHSNVSTTQHYFHSNDLIKRKVVESL